MNFEDREKHDQTPQVQPFLEDRLYFIAPAPLKLLEQVGHDMRVGFGSHLAMTLEKLLRGCAVA